MTQCVNCKIIEIHLASISKHPKFWYATNLVLGVCRTTTYFKHSIGKGKGFIKQKFYLMEIYTIYSTTNEHQIYLLRFQRNHKLEVEYFLQIFIFSRTVLSSSYVCEITLLLDTRRFIKLV